MIHAFLFGLIQTHINN